MNTTHDWHRLSRTGFRGLDRIERDRRMDALLVKAGNYLLVFLAGAACGLMWR